MTRKEAIDIINSIKYIVKIDDYSDRLEIALDMAVEALKEQRPHGEWKYESYGQYLSTYKCSNCGFHGDKQWIYCPYCGSDMRNGGEAE